MEEIAITPEEREQVRAFVGPDFELFVATIMSLIYGSPGERANATALLELVARAEPRTFAMKLCFIVSFASDPWSRRVMPQILGDLLLGRYNVWSLLSNSDKQSIKESLLSCLFEEFENHVLAGLCQVISRLAAVILRSGDDWIELLDLLLNSQENPLREKSAMVILGLLFENVNPRLLEITEEIKAAMLHALDNIAHFDVRREALKAVVNFLTSPATILVRMRFINFLPSMVLVLNDAPPDDEATVEALNLFGNLAFAVPDFIGCERVLVVNSVLQITHIEDLDLDTRCAPIAIVVTLIRMDASLVETLPKCFRRFFAIMLSMLSGYSEDKYVALHCLETLGSCPVFGTFVAPFLLTCLPPYLLSPERLKRKAAIAVIAQIAPFLRNAALAPPQAIERGESIATLTDKTEDLHNQAQQYKRQGTQLRRKMWYQNMKIKLVVLGILIFLILVIWLSVCHGFDCSN